MHFDPRQQAASQGRAESALASYVRAIRAHRLLFVAVVAAALLGALLWVALRSPTYEASADLLVSPLPQDSQSLLGIQVLRDSPGDPTRTIQTAASLVESRRAAELTAEALGSGWDAGRVLESIAVEPEGQSNVLAVTGSADTAGEAARVANQFSEAALAARRETLTAQVEATLERLGPRLEAQPNPGSETALALADQVAQLEAIRDAGDPTLALAQAAQPPDVPIGAGPPLVLVLALLGGLALASGAAIFVELLDRSIRDESEATSLYPLPVLARVPILSRRERKAGRNLAWYMPAAVREAFRTLLAQVEARESSRVLMVTSASTGDGKTTSAVNLAASIVASGHTAVLLDLDFRKPDVGSKLGLTDRDRLLSRLSAGAGLAELLRPVPGLPALSVLSPNLEGGDAALVEVMNARLTDLVAEARGLADYVVLDTAPLGEVSDAVRLLPATDETLIVVRPGSTRRINYDMMGDLLQRSGHTPLGLLLVGETPGMVTTYYGYGVARRELRGRSQALG